ncbi:MAG: hypothetical protein HY305_01445, partial [Sphingobacteriales bacterium]|nr:hypothetical protein [Sphingobacteriales bacterium]
DAAFRRVSVAAKISKRWGSSIGIQPFSTVNYNYTANKPVTGDPQSVLIGNYDGTGGVNQFYWANGFQLTKSISIGITPSFLFGSVKETETLYNDLVPSGLITTKSNYLRNAYLNFSLQAKVRLNKNWESGYGITFSPKTSLNSLATVNVVTGGGTVIKQYTTNSNSSGVPATLNIGIALVKNKKYTLTVNAQGQDWSNVKFSNSVYQSVDKTGKLSVGFQNSKKAKNYYNQEYEKSFIQLGLYGGYTNIKAYGENVTDIGATVGYGRNAKRSPLGYILGLQVGRRGGKSSTLLSENYINLNITFSYVDLWFKGKKYY